METYIDTYNHVSMMINVNLSKTDKRFVIYKTRAFSSKSRENIESLNKNRKHLPGNMIKHLDVANKVYHILNRIGVSDRDIEIYWKYSHLSQKELNNIYSEKVLDYINIMKKLPKQDNKDYVAKGNSFSYNHNKIRYPKKCRKTAWKRFYKLFPRLKPENNE